MAIAMSLLLFSVAGFLRWIGCWFDKNCHNAKPPVVDWHKRFLSINPYELVDLKKLINIVEFC
jgi:hypothetical protein